MGVSISLRRILTPLWQKMHFVQEPLISTIVLKN